MYYPQIQIRDVTILFCKGIFLFSFVFPLMTHAAEFYFGTQTKESASEIPVEVGVFLNTQGETVNAVEGSITFPPMEALLTEIRDGGSSVNMWIERPHVIGDGEIRFAGIFPGGMNHTSVYLFSIVVQGKKTGILPITSQNERVLLHDGRGTKTDVSRSPLYFEIKKNSETPPFLPPNDVEPPESFVPELVQDENLYGGAWALVFATEDKISGMDHFEIKEVREFGIWNIEYGKKENRSASSPYMLHDQKLSSKIVVKAIDRSGNERVTIIEPQNPIFWYENSIFWGIILGGWIFIFSILFFYHKHKASS